MIGFKNETKRFKYHIGKQETDSLILNSGQNWPLVYWQLMGLSDRRKFNLHEGKAYYVTVACKWKLLPQREVRKLKAGTVPLVQIPGHEERGK